MSLVRVTRWVIFTRDLCSVLGECVYKVVLAVCTGRPVAIDGSVVLLLEAVTFFFTCVAEVEPTGTTIPSSGTLFMIVVVAVMAALARCFGWKVIFTKAYRR